MTDESQQQAENPEWLSAGEAVATLTSFASRQAAIDVIVTRAAAGEINTTARKLIMTRRITYMLNSASRTEEHDVPVPAFLWGKEIHGSPELGWLTGDFRWHAEDDRDDFTIATGVRFDKSGIEAIAFSISSSVTPIPQPSAKPKRGGAGGRPPSSWWPKFAEELAVYVHEFGPPPGQDAGGQATVIDAILEQLAKAGCDVPGENTVRPVVAAVLRRIRESEN